MDTLILSSKRVRDLVEPDTRRVLKITLELPTENVLYIIG